MARINAILLLIRVTCNIRLIFLFVIKLENFSRSIIHIFHALFVNKLENDMFVIHAITQHGATIIRGEGSYKNDERKMIYSVINESSEKAIVSNILAIDPKAFVNCVRTKEIRGHFNQIPKD